MTLSLFLAESAKTVACGRMYPLRRPVVPPSESREDVDLPENEETEEAVETERSKSGQADRASEGDAQGGGEDERVSVPVTSSSAIIQVFEETQSSPHALYISHTDSVKKLLLAKSWKATDDVSSGCFSY